MNSRARIFKIALTVAIVSSAVIVGIGSDLGLKYHQSSLSKKAGDSLFSQQKYTEAAQKYEESYAKWRNNQTLQKVAESRGLAASQIYFALGLKSIETKDYQKSEEQFAKVIPEDKQYGAAQTKIEECKQALETQAKEQDTEAVASAKEETKEENTSAAKESASSTTGSTKISDNTSPATDTATKKEDTPAATKPASSTKSSDQPTPTPIPAAVVKKEEPKQQSTPLATVAKPANIEAILGTTGPIEIKGDDNCKSITQEKLNLISSKDPDDFNNIVEKYLGIINCADRQSGTYSWERPPRFQVGTLTMNSGMMYAGAIVHDSYHSKLYNDYLIQNNVKTVPLDIYSGEGAETKCVEVQIVAMRKMGTDELILTNLRNSLKSKYWEVPFEDRYW